MNRPKTPLFQCINRCTLSFSCSGFKSPMLTHALSYVDGVNPENAGRRSFFQFSEKPTCSSKFLQNDSNFETVIFSWEKRYFALFSLPCAWYSAINEALFMPQNALGILIFAIFCSIGLILTLIVLEPGKSGTLIAAITCTVGLILTLIACLHETSKKLSINAIARRMREQNVNTQQVLNSVSSSQTANRNNIETSVVISPSAPTQQEYWANEVWSDKIWNHCQKFTDLVINNEVMEMFPVWHFLDIPPTYGKRNFSVRVKLLEKLL